MILPAIADRVECLAIVSDTSFAQKTADFGGNVVMPRRPEIGRSELGFHGFLDIMPLVTGINDPRCERIEAFQRPAIRAVTPVAAVREFVGKQTEPSLPGVTGEKCVRIGKRARRWQSGN